MLGKNLTSLDTLNQILFLFFHPLTKVSTRIFKKKLLEIFYLNSNLNFGILPVMVFQLEVYYKVDSFLTGLTAQQKGTDAQWYSNKTSICILGMLGEFVLKTHEN